MAVENIWAEPEGYTRSATPTVVYRILDKASGAVVERRTESMFDSKRVAYFLAFAAADQAFAYEISAAVQRCCSYFFSKDDYTPMDGWAESRVTDDEVRARIRRLDLGENSREAERTNKRRYPLTELPWAQQRALIETIDRIKHEWQFEWVGEVAKPPVSPELDALTARYEDWLVANVD